MLERSRVLRCKRTALLRVAREQKEWQRQRRIEGRELDQVDEGVAGYS